MKGCITACAVILFAALFIAVMPTDSEADIYEDTLRLHILAASDAEEDQNVKLFVKDRLTEKYGAELSEARSLTEAEERARLLLSDIEKDAEGWTEEYGRRQEADAEIVTEWYDRRDYKGFSLPAGYYRSLKITLGDGVGKNWWCVMYPPLCEELATDGPADDGIIDYTGSEYYLITKGRYNVKFKLLEVFSEAFREK